MSDTPAPEGADGSPAENPGPTPEPSPEPAAPGANRLARDYWARQREELEYDITRSQLERMREEKRQKQAEETYRERLSSGLDAHEAAAALEVEPDKKSPRARRLAMVRDAANRRSRTVKWAAPTAVALAIALVFVGVFVSRDKDDPVATFDSVVASVTSEAATPTTSAPAEQTNAEPGPQSVESGDPYLEARAALGLSTTTPSTVEHINAGAGPMLYELSWVDGAGAPRAKLGAIGMVTLTEDRAMQEGGRATLDGSESVGAYVIGKEAGQVNIGVRIAIRVPGPDGGEPRLTIFSLENTEGSSLVGTAKRYRGGDPDPPWYVLGERLKNN